MPTTPNKFNLNSEEIFLIHSLNLEVYDYCYDLDMGLEDFVRLLLNKQLYEYRIDGTTYTHYYE